MMTKTERIENLKRLIAEETETIARQDIPHKTWANAVKSRNFLERQLKDVMEDKTD